MSKSDRYPLDNIQLHFEATDRAFWEQIISVAVFRLEPIGVIAGRA